MKSLGLFSVFLIFVQQGYPQVFLMESNRFRFTEKQVVKAYSGVQYVSVAPDDLLLLGRRIERRFMIF